MRYFTNLEFYPRTKELGSGIQGRRNLLTVLMYILLSLGIFAHEAVRLYPLGFRPTHWSTIAASFVVGLALLPPAIRWINVKTDSPSLIQVVTAFSLGFFIDLSSKGVIGQVWKLIAR